MDYLNLFKLGPELKIYTDFPLAFDKPNPTKTIEIPKEGFILRPGCLYLGTTIEQIFIFINLQCKI